MDSKLNWNLEVLIFCGGRKTREPEGKPLEQGENQQQTQPTYDSGPRLRTRARLVGGERSNPFTISAPLTNELEFPCQHPCEFKALNYACLP